MRTEKGLTNPKSEEFTKAMWGDPFYNALHVKVRLCFLHAINHRVVNGIQFM